MTLSGPDVAELVEDIDAQLKLATHGFAGYRDGFRVGWEGAIRKMRIELGLGDPMHDRRWHISAILKLLDELAYVNDVPEPKPEPGTTEVLLNLEERLCKLEDASSTWQSQAVDAGVAKYANWERRIEALEAWRKQDHVVNLSNRIAALENHPERLGSSDKHIDQRVEVLEKRIEELEKSTEAQTLSFDRRLEFWETLPEHYR